MHRSMSAVFASVLLFAASHANASVVYSIDDGVSESSFGRAESGTLTAANQFTVVAGGESITSILIAFGTPVLPDLFTNGRSVTVKLWSDPNGDGNPSDAVLLASAIGVSAFASTDTFASFAIPAVTLGVGTSFFAGLTLDHETGEFPIALDQTSPDALRSWANLGDNITDSPLALSSVGIGDAMIRVGATSGAPVPEPTTLALSALALAGCAIARRRRAN